MATKKGPVGVPATTKSVKKYGQKAAPKMKTNPQPKIRVTKSDKRA